MQALVAELTAKLATVHREIQALAHNVGIFERMRVWDTLSQEIAGLRSSMASGVEVDVSNIDGLHSLDDLMDKLEDVEIG